MSTPPTTLAEEFLPVYDVSDAVAVVVAADVEATWRALLRADLIEFADADAAHFTGFDEPGYAKTVYALSVRPLDDGRTLLSGLMRTANTDEHARRWFRRYRTFGVGSGAHVLVGGLLDVVRDDAEATP